MRNILLLSILCLTSFWIHAQQEKLEIEGAIKIGNSEDPTPAPGTIRWAGTDFQGWNGTSWVSLTAGKQYVKDIDNNSYEIVTIGTQVWMSENLRATHYNDKTPIQIVTDNTAWSSLSTPAYTWYNNGPSEYGALYNYYTVADTNSLNVCPTGWHVPSDTEWTMLTDFLDETSTATGKMTETGLSHWNSPNTVATNESGFTGLPGGVRVFDGTFGNIGQVGNWWSSTESSSNIAWYRFLNTTGILARHDFDKRLGCSVRCLRD